MRYYYIRHDENSQCDDEHCLGETEILYNDGTLRGWQKIDTSAPFRDPELGKKFKKKCIKCKKEFPVKVTTLDTKK